MKQPSFLMSNSDCHKVLYWAKWQHCDSFINRNYCPSRTVNTFIKIWNKSIHKTCLDDFCCFQKICDENMIEGYELNENIYNKITIKIRKFQWKPLTLNRWCFWIHNQKHLTSLLKNQFLLYPLEISLTVSPCHLFTEHIDWTHITFVTSPQLLIEVILVIWTDS